MLYADASQLCEILERLREGATVKKVKRSWVLQDNLEKSMNDIACFVAEASGVCYEDAEFQDGFGGLLVGFSSVDDVQKIPEILKDIDDEGWNGGRE